MDRNVGKYLLTPRVKIFTLNYNQWFWQNWSLIHHAPKNKLHFQFGRGRPNLRDCNERDNFREGATTVPAPKKLLESTFWNGFGSEQSCLTLYFKNGGGSNKRKRGKNSFPGSWKWLLVEFMILLGSKTMCVRNLNTSLMIRKHFVPFYEAFNAGLAR